MRFLRLDFRDDLNSLDIHPLLTVVSSLETHQKRQLLEAVRRLSSGSTIGLRGLVEHQGLMVELDPGAGSTLAPITTDAGLIVHIDGEAIRASEIGLQAEIDQWERQAAIDALTVEEIRSDLDLSVRARARRLMGPETDDNSPGAHQLRIAAVREAFDNVNSHEATIAQCDDLVLELIADWERYCHRRAESEEHLTRVASEVAEAEKSFGEKAKILESAQEDATPVLLTPQQEARLEELFDQDDGQSRLGKWKGGPTEEEEQEREELLELVGVRSWTEYSVFRMSPTVRPDKKAALEAAETDYAAAEQSLERARSMQANDAVASELDAELERIKSASEPYLGVLVPSDLGAALNEQIEHVDNPDWVAAIDDLRNVLSSNDLHPPAGFETGEVLGWTESWLRAEGSLKGADQDEEETPELTEEERQAKLDSSMRLLAKHNRALSHISKAERAAVRSALRVRELKGQMRDRSSAEDAKTAAQVVSLVAPVAEQVLKEIGGSVPMAVIGDLKHLQPGEVDSLMGAMEEVARQVQVIFVTENEDVRAWAERVGLERASVARGTRVLL